MSNNDYDFKTKHGAVAISMKNTEKVNKLIEQADELAYDDSKNEKLAVEFRTVLLVKGQGYIIDISQYLDKTLDGKLLDGKTLQSYIEQYSEYVANGMNDKNSVFYKNVTAQFGDVKLEDLKSEITTTYYPLDPKNKKENIPDLGNFVTYCKYLEGGKLKMFKYTVDCSKEVKPAPNMSMVGSIAEVAQSIKTMRTNMEIDNAAQTSGYNKNTLH